MPEQSSTDPGHKNDEQRDGLSGTDGESLLTAKGEFLVVFVLTFAFALSVVVLF